jgi:hypothetical protein
MGRQQDIDIGIVGIGQDLGGDVDMPKVIVSISHPVSVGRDVSWLGYRSLLTLEEGQKAKAHQAEQFISNWGSRPGARELASGSINPSFPQKS